MNSNVFAKVVFGLTCVLILAFLAIGVYYCVNDNVNSGVVGIGISLVAMGLTGILMDGVLFNTNKRSRSKANVSGNDSAVSTGTASGVLISGITHCESGGQSQDSLTAGFKADPNEISVKMLFQDTVTIKYGDINTLTRDGEKLRMSCSFEVSNKHKAGSFTIQAPSAIKAKAFEQYVRRQMEASKT